MASIFLWSCMTIQSFYYLTFNIISTKLYAVWKWGCHTSLDLCYSIFFKNKTKCFNAFYVDEWIKILTLLLMCFQNMTSTFTANYVNYIPSQTIRIIIILRESSVWKTFDTNIFFYLLQRYFLIDMSQYCNLYFKIIFMYPSI